MPSIEKYLKKCGIWSHLWLQVVATCGFIKPTTFYVLSNEGKNRFLQIIKNLKSLTSYIYSLKKRVHMDGEMKEWNLMTIMSWCKRFFYCACNTLWQKDVRWPQYKLILCFKKSLCQDCGPNYNWRAKERGGNDISITPARTPTLILWHHDAFVSSFSGRTRNLQTRPYKMDVPYWTLLENVERICLQ